MSAFARFVALFRRKRTFRVSKNVLPRPHPLPALPSSDGQETA